MVNIEQLFVQVTVQYIVFGNGFLKWDKMKCHNFLYDYSYPLPRPSISNEVSIGNESMWLSYALSWEWPDSGRALPGSPCALACVAKGPCALWEATQMWDFCLVLLQSKWSPFHNFYQLIPGIFMYTDSAQANFGNSWTELKKKKTPGKGLWEATLSTPLPRHSPSCHSACLGWAVPCVSLGHTFCFNLSLYSRSDLS